MFCPKSLQIKIQALCPEIKTVAFGRITDFYRQIDQLPPNAILSLEPVVSRKELTQKKPYKSQLTGHYMTQYEEEYFLVSLNEKVDLTQLSSLKIGVLDILGRKAMSHFMNELFHTTLHLKRVIKTEDFLPLLTLEMADAIFISKNILIKMRKKSRQKLVATSTNIYIGLAITGIYHQSNNQISQCIAQLDESTNALLGLDQWEIVP
jgi:hypothetical protein